jgi:hypothetical protein
MTSVKQAAVRPRAIINPVLFFYARGFASASHHRHCFIEQSQNGSMASVIVNDHNRIASA